MSQARGGALLPGHARSIATTVAEGLCVLHNSNIVHRDLKPRNVLRVSDQWKLADFGISKNVSRLVTQRTFQTYGTPGYGAPEQFDGAEAAPSADVYSFGKLLVFLLCGQTDPDRILFPSWRALIDRCIIRTPSDRPAAIEILQILEQIPV